MADFGLAGEITNRGSNRSNNLEGFGNAIKMTEAKREVLRE